MKALFVGIPISSSFSYYSLYFNFQYISSTRQTLITNHIRTLKLPNNIIITLLISPNFPTFQDHHIILHYRLLPVPSITSFHHLNHGRPGRSGIFASSFFFPEELPRPPGFAAGFLSQALSINYLCADRFPSVRPILSINPIE